MKSTKQILVEARELIARGWAQKHLATDAFGRKVLPWEPAAECWCSYGAIAFAVGDGVGIASACAELRSAIGHGDIVPWNDAPERTQAEVLAAFDRAIAEAS
jgi:hypothetical protein